MCVFLRIVVSNTYCVVVFFCLVFCVPYVASFSRLSIFYWFVCIIWRLLDCAVNLPFLTNWFHFTIWETRIAETSRVLYNYSSNAKSNNCMRVPVKSPSNVYLRALHVLFGHSDTVILWQRRISKYCFPAFYPTKKKQSVCELRYVIVNYSSYSLSMGRPLKDILIGFSSIRILS